MKNTKYIRNKEKAETKAIEWQIASNCYDYSYSELSYYYEYFLKLGKRYGLIKVFKENGIL